MQLALLVDNSRERIVRHVRHRHRIRMHINSHPLGAVCAAAITPAKPAGGRCTTVLFPKYTARSAVG